MVDLRLARSLYCDERFDGCLAELYSKTVIAKFFVWGLVFSCFVLSFIVLRSSLGVPVDNLVAGVVAAFVAAFVVAFVAVFAGSIAGIAGVLAFVFAVVVFVAVAATFVVGTAVVVAVVVGVVAAFVVGEELIRILCKKILESYEVKL